MCCTFIMTYSFFKFSEDFSIIMSFVPSNSFKDLPTIILSKFWTHSVSSGSFSSTLTIILIISCVLSLSICLLKSKIFLFAAFLIIYFSIVSYEFSYRNAGFNLLALISFSYDISGLFLNSTKIL